MLIPVKYSGWGGQLALARRPRTILLSLHPITQGNFNYLSVSTNLCSPNYFHDLQQSGQNFPENLEFPEFKSSQ